MGKLRYLNGFKIKIFDDLFFDFGLGLRIKSYLNQYRIKMIDTYTGIIHVDTILNKGKELFSPFRFYIKWKLEVYKQNKLVYQHTIDLNNQDVLIDIDGNVIGDTLAWMPAIDKFQKKHNCNLIMYHGNKQIIDILKPNYPNITFTNNFKDKNKIYYAYYQMSIGNVLDQINAPYDSKFVGLKQIAYLLLNVKYNQNDIVKLSLNKSRQINQKYVVISCGGSSSLKRWTNKKDWEQVIDFLKQNGYKVYQIGTDEQLIQGCINQIGQKHLQQRIDLIKDADCFIGMSSGLSWIANACKIPIVLICGFTFPNLQFYTPYRVQAIHGCRGCFHNIQPNINKECHYKGTPKQYQCYNNITALQVINTVKRAINL